MLLIFSNKNFPIHMSQKNDCENYSTTENLNVNNAFTLLEVDQA